MRNRGERGSPPPPLGSWRSRPGALERLEVPRLFVVPDEPTELLGLEPDGSRRDLMPLLERAGYGLVKREPVIEDRAVRELLRVRDHFHHFERA
jgi:hypothetical protein